mmetsp:Transcript_11363/g.34433  ORF Transcript_11363/g.34433 Transcript_11363/m.34433 type:complete len:558 (-) Transcript_11363:102-1775(-)
MVRRAGARVGTELLEYVAEGRRLLDVALHAEGQPMRLPGLVVRILAEDHDLGLLERAEAQRVEHLLAWREDRPALVLRREEAHEVPEVLLGRLVLEGRAPRRVHAVQAHELGAATGGRRRGRCSPRHRGDLGVHVAGDVARGVHLGCRHRSRLLARAALLLAVLLGDEEGVELLDGVVREVHVLQRREGAAVDGAGPVLVDGRHVPRRGVALVLLEVVLGVHPCVLHHEAVPGDLGEDGRGADDVLPTVALDERLAAARQGLGHAVAVDEGVAAGLAERLGLAAGARHDVAAAARRVRGPRRVLLLHDGGAALGHALHRRLEDVDLVDAPRVDDGHGPAHARRRHDEVIERLALLLRGLLRVVDAGDRDVHGHGAGRGDHGAREGAAARLVHAHHEGHALAAHGLLAVLGQAARQLDGVIVLGWRRLRLLLVGGRLRRCRHRDLGLGPARTLRRGRRGGGCGGLGGAVLELGEDARLEVCLPPGHGQPRGLAPLLELREVQPVQVQIRRRWILVLRGAVLAHEAEHGAGAGGLALAAGRHGDGSSGASGTERPTMYG